MAETDRTPHRGGPDLRTLREEAVEEVLSDPASRYILAACVPEARPVKAIAEAAGLSQTTAYRHVNDLEERGFLIVERSAMTPDGKTYDLYRSRLRSAHLWMEAESVTVEWEVNEAVEDRVQRMWDQLG